MPRDEDIARRTLDMQKRARDVPLPQIPGYMEWSSRKLDEGASEALVAHLDATSIWILPEDASTFGEADFEEMLAELKSEIDG